MVARPLPDPVEDDGRPMSSLILKQITAAITEQYAPDETADFLAEQGIPPKQMVLPDGTGQGDAHATLKALWRWGSAGHREFLTIFPGAALDYHKFQF
jgi:hypothetical protein